MIAKREYLLTRDGKAVPAGHPEGRTVLVGAGSELDDATAKRLGVDVLDGQGTGDAFIDIQEVPQRPAETTGERLTREFGALPTGPDGQPMKPDGRPHKDNGAGANPLEVGSAVAYWKDDDSDDGAGLFVDRIEVRLTNGVTLEVPFEKIEEVDANDEPVDRASIERGTYSATETREDTARTGGEMGAPNGAAVSNPVTTSNVESPENVARLADFAERRGDPLPTQVPTTNVGARVADAGTPDAPGRTNTGQPTEVDPNATVSTVPGTGTVPPPVEANGQTEGAPNTGTTEGSAPTAQTPKTDEKKVDAFEGLTGVNDNIRKVLDEAGIKDKAALLAMSDADLLALPMIGPAKVATWRDDAKGK